MTSKQICIFLCFVFVNYVKIKISYEKIKAMLWQGERDEDVNLDNGKFA